MEVSERSELRDPPVKSWNPVSESGCRTVVVSVGRRRKRRDKGPLTVKVVPINKSDFRIHLSGGRTNY